MRRPPWLLLVFLAFGALLVYGGFSKRSDQTSGTPGQAKVTGCTGGRKYQPGVHCQGTWITGGSLLDGGHVAFGRIDGAGYGDIGKTIDVRIHGTDHATKPSLGTSIILWTMGGVISLLALFALGHWWRRPAAPAA
jgi:hypothetical protein